MINLKLVRISVVMITKNEENSVGLVIEEIKKTVPKAEIILIDSSIDKTPVIAKSLGVNVVRQFPPKGYGPALALGLRKATGLAIVTLDCDQTYPVDYIPKLADYILKKNYDLVDGSRLVNKPGSMSISHYLANKIFALFASVLFFKNISDLHSGMRAYSKNLIRRLNFNENGPALPVELLLLPIRLGFKVKIIGIKYYPRVGMSTMDPITGAWWTLKRIINTRFFR